MIKLLHFADAHIDMAAQGRRDPQTGLPLRVLDFLKSLDTIVDTAINEKVDLVIFAGDAYKDRTPAPTFQREWGRRIMRLSHAGICTVLLVGNHDLSPATGRAHALQEYDTLEVPHIHVIGKPALLGPAELDGLQMQLLALPWVSRSGLLAAMEVQDAETVDKVHVEIEARLDELVKAWLEKVDPNLPTVLTAHASVQGATYGGERSVMLGADVVLAGGLVKDPRLDYVALGHIHKSQNLNEGAHPPVIYPGSIERVDFGEAADDKFFVIAQVEHGYTQVDWRKLEGRRFIDRYQRITDADDFQHQALQALPPRSELQDAIVRLVLEYPHDWDALFNETELRQAADNAFEFHLVRCPQVEARLRMPGDQTLSSLSPLDLLSKYWGTISTDPEELVHLQKLAGEVLGFDGQDATDE